MLKTFVNIYSFYINQIKRYYIKNLCNGVHHDYFIYIYIHDMTLFI